MTKLAHRAGHGRALGVCRPPSWRRGTAVPGHLVQGDASSSHEHPDDGSGVLSSDVLHARIAGDPDVFDPSPALLRSFSRYLPERSQPGGPFGDQHESEHRVGDDVVIGTDRRPLCEGAVSLEPGEAGTADGRSRMRPAGPRRSAPCRSRTGGPHRRGGGCGTERRRKASLKVSDTDSAPSANNAAEPVRAAPTNFAKATTTLAASATSTVRLLSSAIPSFAIPSFYPNRSPPSAAGVAEGTTRLTDQARPGWRRRAVRRLPPAAPAP